jgi:hypothetical protein
MIPAIAAKTRRLGIMMMRTGALQRSQQLTRKQRQAERIAFRRHLLLSSCVHFRSCQHGCLVLSKERVNAFSHAEFEKASNYQK